MRVEPLGHERLADFVKYCLKHRKEVDESFLYDEDLHAFRPGKDNPTYVLVDVQGELIGVASLILDEYRQQARAGRFRILHCEVVSQEAHQVLMQAILKHTEGLDRLFVFVPLANRSQTEMVQGLGFYVERYAFEFARPDLDVPDVAFPEGYEVRSFVPGKDEEAWCEVRNAAFATLRGSETPVTPAMVADMASRESSLGGEMLILFHGDRPIGVVRCTPDEHEGLPAMEIGPLAIIPEYQGRGLGRSLLRTALKIAKEGGYSQTVLSVNAENERAKSLYIQEGFREIEAVACYAYSLLLPSSSLAPHIRTQNNPTPKNIM